MQAKALAPAPETSARTHRLQRPVFPWGAALAGRPLLRPMLKLGAARDEAENQADHLAERALRGSAPAPTRATPAPTDAKAAVRRVLAPRQVAPQPPVPPAIEEEQTLPEALEERLLALQRGGQPLPEGARRDLEPRFGLDLSGVRIHTDAEAARLAEAVGAHAFTLGEHIAFNRGRFQPEHPTGRRLLAHELAHVAQQRAGRGEPEPVRRGFWSDLYEGAVDTLGDIAEWGLDQVREYGWRLLEAISPEFARTVRAILDEGILPWLGRMVARAWDAYLGTLRALVPFEGPRQLIDLFAGLVERAAGILAALASGDCAPLMAAIDELRTFVTQVVGVAWDRLSEFLAPIGEFFRGLWADFGAPALRWLQELGGGIWEEIQTLGRRFWDWIRPVREAAERIWGWFKDTLFGPDAGDGGSTDSQGGVIGWIGRKAGEAWDWVREQTRPVWQPVADYGGQVAQLIPPAFVRELGESAGQLSTALDGASEGMGGGGGLPEGRNSLAAILPSVQALLAGVRRIIVGAGDWLSGRIAALGAAVTGLIGRLSANALLSWLSGALGWLAEGIDGLLAWAREGVAGLFTFLVRGFDALTPFLQLVLETVRRLISVAADLLQLPLLILNALWQRVPACIREPIERFIQNQILARIPVFGQFFSDPELWPRVRDTALGILRRIFVDGDLPAAAWAFFQAVLRLLGLPPELVVQVLAKAAQAVADILGDPIGFLTNLLRALAAGFRGFFERIGTHLLSGFTGWLFGTLRQAGIEPPADPSLRSILGLVLQVLGITRDNLFARLARHLDPAIVARLQSMLEIATGVWSFVVTLVNEGPAGLWRELSERLSNLWDSLVEGVIGFVTERVIGWASRWLLSLLDITGIMPVVNTLVAIYRAIESFMQYLRELLEIVSRVLDGVAGIARGAIGEAAGFLESALASALPVAIGFLANQAGLGRLSERLREILGGLRERVNGAIDWLIERALRLGRALIDLVRRGAASIREWWRQRFGFRGADGQEHSIYFRGEGDRAELIVESEPQSFQSFLDGRPDGPDKDQAQRLYSELLRVQRTAGAPTAGGAAGPTPPGGAAPEERIVRLTQELATLAARLMDSEAGIPEATPPAYGPLREGFGTSVEVRRLTRRIPPGSEPSIEGGLWNNLNQRRYGGGSYYIRGHLLNHHVGGGGYTWANLTPLTRSANSSMSSSFEEPVKTAVNDQGKVVYFRVSTESGSPPDRSAEVSALRNPENPNAEDRLIASVIESERAVPTRITGIAREVPADTPADAPPSSSWREVSRLDQSNSPERALGEYSVTDSARTSVSLSSSPRSLIRQLPGVTDDLADRVEARQRAVGVFRTQAQFLSETGAPAGIFAGFESSSRFTVRLFTRS